MLRKRNWHPPFTISNTNVIKKRIKTEFRNVKSLIEWWNYQHKSWKEKKYNKLSRSKNASSYCYIQRSIKYKLQSWKNILWNNENLFLKLESKLNVSCSRNYNSYLCTLHNGDIIANSNESKSLLSALPYMPLIADNRVIFKKYF